MSAPRSKIAWCDYSGQAANVVIRGATASECEASAGCAHCYALAILRRNGRMAPTTTFNPVKLAALARTRFTPGATPYRRGPGSRPLVFVADMGDLCHPAVASDDIRRVLATLAARPDVDWQVLTKRSARLAEVAAAYGWPANVWAGVTVENQAAAQERIPHLLTVPAAVRFLSCEPLLGPLDLTPWLAELQQVIVGAESGPQRRPFDRAWARDVRDQCRAAGVAFFYKQSSGLRPGADPILDGVTHREFPHAPELP